MATFYVLPSRQMLGQRFSDILASLFPGTKHTLSDWPELAAAIASMVEGQGSACVVYREDMDDALSVRDTLVRYFGAALDDEIVEVHFGAGLHQVMYQRWATERIRSAA